MFSISSLAPFLGLPNYDRARSGVGGFRRPAKKRESRESPLLSELAFVPFFDFAPARRAEVQVALDRESGWSSD